MADSSLKDKEHTYSSGNGLFLIKDIIMILGGTYNYEAKDNNVKLSLFISADIKNKEDGEKMGEG